MDMTEIELKPCPFCGGKADHLYRVVPLSKWRHRIVCKSTTCGMEGPVEATKAEAISAWNHRATESLIRSCLLDKPEAGEGEAVEVPTGVLNDMLLARAPDCRWTIASILKQHGLNYRQRLDYMRAALVASRATSPADTDAAQQ